MNRTRVILSSLKHTNSLLLTRIRTTRSVPTQVTQLCPVFPLRTLLETYQNHFFCTKSSSITDHLLASKWSTELETEIENMNREWTHELIVYRLKSLDKEPLKALDFFNWVCDRNGVRPSSSLYSLLLRIVAKKDTIGDFWIVIKRMQEEGFCIDEETYMTILGVFKYEGMSNDVIGLTHFYDRMAKENGMDDVVKNVVSIVSMREWDYAIEKQLEGMGFVLSDDFVIRVLKELRSCPLKGLRFFCWAGGCSDYQHNSVTYNALLRVVCKEDSIGQFWRVVEEMRSAGYEIDIDTYVKVSRYLQKGRLLEDAVKLYEFMVDGPFKPSVQDTSILLRTISSSRDPNLDLVIRVTEKYREAGIALPKAFYDGMHRALTSLGKFDKAVKVMNDMRKAGFQPDNITYSQLVYGLCKDSKFEEACRVLDEMEADGCIPDVKTWTILIQGHCFAGEIDKALICLSKMIDKNMDADAELLGVLVNGFLDQNRIDDACSLLLDMVNNRNLVPFHATYKSLIETLLGVRKLKEALDLLQYMRKHKYPPHAEPFIQYLSQFGSVQDTLGFLGKLSVKGYPSHLTYVKVFESFFKEGRYSEAKDLLFKSPPHIRQNSKISYLFGSAESDNVPRHSEDKSIPV